MIAARRMLRPQIGAVLAVALAACGKSGPKVALRFHPPAGAVYHYALEQHSRIKFEAGPAPATVENQLTVPMTFTRRAATPGAGRTPSPRTSVATSASSPI